MGYTTDFAGEFKLNTPLRPEHKAYLERFGDSRRMMRDPLVALKFQDPLRIAVDLPIGIDAEFYVGTDDGDKETYAPSDPRHVVPNPGKWADNEPAEHGCFAGQRHDASVVEYNYPPITQPGLWCQWMPNENGDAIEWDGSEKFYHYTEWLVYLIDKFLKPWGYVLNGEVVWHGEESDDTGKIGVEDNVVRGVKGRVVFDQ